MIFRRKDYKIKQAQGKNLSILKVFFLEKRGLMNQNQVSFFLRNVLLSVVLCMDFYIKLC